MAVWGVFEGVSTAVTKENNLGAIYGDNRGIQKQM